MDQPQPQTSPAAQHLPDQHLSDQELRQELSALWGGLLDKDAWPKSAHDTFRPHVRDSTTPPGPSAEQRSNEKRSHEKGETEPSAEQRPLFHPQAHPIGSEVVVFIKEPEAGVTSGIFDPISHIAHTWNGADPIIPGTSRGGVSDGDFHARFEILDRLGSGGMGDVYLAKQLSLGRQVAVKVLKDSVKDSPEAGLFRAEARVTARLEHPGIVPVYDLGDGWQAMKRIRGVTMSEMLVAPEDVPGRRLSQLIEALVKACDAIAYAHAMGVIHRDIKAVNLMMGVFGEVQVLDWGLALSYGPAPDGTYLAPSLADNPQWSCAGTPSCLPPETARGDSKRIGPRSDVFQFGALLYHMLSDSFPFKGDDIMEVVENAAKNRYIPLDAIASERRLWLPATLVDLQEYAMATDPAERPTLNVFANTLRSWLHRCDADARARAALQDGERALALAQSDESRSWQELYRIYQRALRDLDRALALDPTLGEAVVARRVASEAFSEAALAAGDLALARILARESREVSEPLSS